MGKADAGARTLDDVVDGLGVGLGQYLVVLLGGEVFSGLMKTLVTATAASFAHDLGFTKFERSALVSTVFIGNLLGNLGSGLMSDCCGRRKTLLLGYIFALVSLSTSLLTSSFSSMMLCRIGFGLAAGLMGPTSWTLLGEVAPSQRRMFMHSLGHFTWYAGAMTILLLVHFEDPTMQHVPWRSFTALTLGIVVVCTLGAFLFVVESPSYLCVHGRRDEAVEVLETLRSRNGVELNVSDFEVRPTEAQPSSLSWSYKALFQRSTLYTTATLCVSTFSLNYSSYGMMYALPIILRNSKLDVVPSTTMLINLACGAIGLAVALPVSAASSSRVSLLGYVLLGRAACCLLFFLGLWHQNDSPFIAAVTLFGVFGKTLLDSIAYLLVYLYAVEVRGTESRASSSGMALAIGRIGGVFAPIVFEVLPYTPSSFVFSMCILAVICSALVLGLPVETKDRQLGDIAAESAILPKQVA